MASYAQVPVSIDVSTTAYPLKTRILARMLSGLMRFIHATCRKSYSNLEVLQAQFDSGHPCIIVAWHNRNILGPFGYLRHRPRGRVFSPLASASRDGSLAAAAMENLGVQCIRGSSSRGGAQALREMLRAVKKGHDLGITPDGPRGPKYEVQAGVIAAARLTGIPIIPMTYQASRRKELGSWDAMIVPYPFGHLHYVYGQPMRVPRDASEEALETLRLNLQQEMLRINAVAAEFPD